MSFLTYFKYLNVFSNHLIWCILAVVSTKSINKQKLKEECSKQFPIVIYWLDALSLIINMLWSYSTLSTKCFISSLFSKAINFDLIGDIRSFLGENVQAYFAIFCIWRSDVSKHLLRRN